MNLPVWGAIATTSDVGIIMSDMHDIGMLDALYRSKFL